VIKSAANETMKKVPYLDKFSEAAASAPEASVFIIQLFIETGILNVTYF